MKGSHWRWLPALAAILSLHCASARLLIRAEPKNAEELYKQSMDDMESGLFPEALKGFGDLKAKYPYTKYAALADLRSADTQFHRAKYADAVEAYRAFLKLHPNHEESAYAMLQIAEAYYEQIPEDWFFLPPAAEKEQSNVKLAIGAYTDMLARYGDTKHGEKGKKRLAECRSKLADHELYVAKFYQSRDRWAAAAGRAEGLLASYGDLGHDEEALWIAGNARFQLGELEKAEPHLKAYKERFPKGSWASDAATLLGKIQGAAKKPAASGS